ncbi:DNA polymerase/3'-5' exonuclease PolX [Anaeromyxobacter terrae]|uniref:DNA polymerase/3'-5' exonuclease PolX n=1 Tax=Anaeromyxobacter terrae TaxID=2925406 RepID=UPI001F570D64|nr:DNA polymerase/3'-5' exonuclease PolX [Anaeromyxobacter sp. SG22]
MENAEVARVLGEIADLLELTGGNAFKVRAYRRAAQVIDVHPGSISELCREGRVAELPGVGAHIAAKIGELVETGECREHARLSALVPPGVLDMLRLEGIGPKTVEAVWKTLGITDVAALEAACRSGRVLDAAHVGPTRARAILGAIERQRGRAGRMLLHRALGYAAPILERLRTVPGVRRAEVAGSLRRRKETIGDLDLLVASDDAAPVVRAFTGLSGVTAVLAEGPTKASVRLRAGIQADLRVLAPGSFGAALHYFTGSKSHNIAIRTRAMKRGLKISEYGVFDRQGRVIGGAAEEDVFRAVGLPFIPPELREGMGEIEAAEAGRLPRLVEESELLGDLHVHSRASSDSRSELAEIAASAGTLGRRYVAITDHSRARPLGLDAPRLAEHAAAIRALDARLGGRPHLLAGVEVDVLPTGALDLPEEALAGLDCVVASIHSHLADPAARNTERIVRALRSGVVHVLGHPTGRQLGTRDAYALDLERVLDVAREEDVALEVNAMPERLDLTDAGCRAAKAAGVPVVISTDAHDATQLANLRYGVWVARRGWLEAKDVLNTLPLAELRRRLRRRGATARTAPGR